MTVDLYKLCPCGSGKKIKFCCRELANDLERIRRMVEGEQRLAAIDKIDALLKKHPDQIALLMLKAEVSIQLKEYDKASPLVNRVLELEPENPSAHAMVVFFKIADGAPVSEVLTAIQTALQCVREVMTRTVYDALFSVVMYLIAHGHPFSAKGYLQFAVMVSDGKDSRCISMLNQLNRMPEVPFLIREHIDSGARPQNVTWAREFDVAMRIASKGVWGRAADMLSGMSYRILDEPTILRNLAIIQALNAQDKQAAETFRMFARLKRVQLLDRVHATALADIFDPEKSGKNVDVVSITFTVKDAEKVLELLLSKREMHQLQLQPQADQPPPKGVFEFLDKPMPNEADDLKLEDLPKSRANLVLFGKQTTKDARIEVVLAKSSDFEKTLEDLSSVIGDQLGERGEETKIGSTTWQGVEVFGAYRFPLKTKTEKRAELLRENRQKAIFETWPDKPCPSLDNKSPREAAKEEKYHLQLLAETLLFEINSEIDEWGLDIAALHKSVGMPELEPIDPAQRLIAHIPVSHLGRVDIENLSDDDLLSAYRYSFAVLAGGILYKIALELSKRASVNDKIDKVEVYDVLSDLSRDTDESLEWLEKARKLATSQGESPAHWLIDEMEIRLIRGEVEKFETLMREVQTRYIREPGVAQTLIGMLQRFGLVTPDGRPMRPTEAPEPPKIPEPVGATVDKVWTPDGGTPAEGGEGNRESKLWIPGMD